MILQRLAYMINFGFLISFQVLAITWPDYKLSIIVLLCEWIWCMNGIVLRHWMLYLAKRSFISIYFSAVLSLILHSIKRQSNPPDNKSGELDFSGNIKSKELQILVCVWSKRPVYYKVDELYSRISP